MNTDFQLDAATAETATFKPKAFRADVSAYTQEVYGQGVNACYWRELLQNCRDAGATQVEITVTATDAEVTTCVKDNGCGMTEAVLRGGLLQYAGSLKAAGAAGGFGIAKNLIVFGVDKYRVRTNDLEVVGEGVKFNLRTVGETVKGTELTAVVGLQGYEAGELIKPTVDGVLYVLARSDMRGMAVKVNGVPVADTQLRGGEEVRDWPKMTAKAFHRKDVSAPKSAGGVPAMVVRHRGIWVMDVTMPEGVEGAVWIDLEGPAKGMLNNSRVRLADYTASEVVDQFVKELARSPKQSLKTKKFVKRYGGELTQLARAEELAERMAEAIFAPRRSRPAGDPVRVVVDRPEVYASTLADRINQRADELLADDAAVVADQGPTEPDVDGDAGVTISALATWVNQKGTGDGKLDVPVGTMTMNRLAVPATDDYEMAQQIKALVWRPALLIVNDAEGDVPAEYLPETMGRRQKALLTIWTEMVKQLLLLNREYIKYGVGFVFSDDDQVKAEWRKEDGTIWFLINPLNAKKKMGFELMSEASCHDLIASAVHEVCHQLTSDKWHGEQFATRQSDTFAQVLTYYKLFKTIWKTAR